MDKNKDSMEKREQIIDLLNKCIIGESVANTADRILALFNVVGQSEQLKCEHKNIKREDGLDECLDCGVKNY